MKGLWRGIKWGFGLLFVAILGLLAPVAYVETMCRGVALSSRPYTPLLTAAHHRPESRTLMTVPEWQIVHAYEDYAKVIATKDPHHFDTLSAIGGYWSSLCSLTEQAANHGGVDGPTKQMVYVIGVSFTAELALKAAYEESFGRLAALIRGAEPAPADKLSATQAADYATFLQQVPWYKWNFSKDAAALKALVPTGLRDRERSFALGLEYGGKAAYAGLIAQAVAATGADELTLQMVVAPNGALGSYDGVKQVQSLPEGVVLETPRYRALTHILQDMAQAGHEFVEIAGNDDILFSVISNAPSHAGAFYSEQRQGFDDYRHLVLTKVSGLAAALRDLGATGAVLEHIHDY